MAGPTSRTLVRAVARQLTSSSGRRSYSVSSQSGPGSPTATAGLKNARRSLGTQVTPRPVEELEEESSARFTLALESIIGQEVLEEISVKNIMIQNPEIQKFVLKVLTVKEDSASGKNEEAGRHPFINAASTLFFQDDEYPANANMPGALVYLVAKMFGNKELLDTKILSLAKCVNQSAAAFRVHRTVKEDGPDSWNKLAVLAGDLLVVETIKNAAAMKDNEIFEWVMESLSDFSIGQFPTFDPNLDVNFNTVVPEASILSTGLRGVAKLSTTMGKSTVAAPEFSKLGHSFGHLWYTAFQKSLPEQSKEAEEHVGQIGNVLRAFPDTEVTKLLQNCAMILENVPRNS